MKKLTLLFAVALTLISCNDRVIYPSTINPDGEGALSLSLGASEETYVIETKAEDSSIDLSEFNVEVVDENDNVVISYESYTDMPDMVSLDAGTYTVRAMNGKMKSAAFDSPWYYGEKQVRIAVGETTSAQVTCEICNVKLTVNYTDTFKSKLSDVQVTVTSIYDNTNAAEPLSGILRYTVDETRAGWFAEPYNNVMTIYVRATNASNGEDVTLSTSLSGVEARQWRKVNLDVKTSGEIGLSIVVDETIDEMPDVDITVPDNKDIIDNNGDNGDWEEEGEDKPKPPVEVHTPTIVGSALGNDEASAPFDINQPVNFELGVSTILDLLITSEAEGGIKNLFLTIDSDVLTDFLESDMLQIYGEIDLANPDPDAAWSTMFADASIGILDPEAPIAGKASHTFSVGPLMDLLGFLPGAVGGSHNFKLRVVDANGEESKTLTIALSGSVN